MERNIPDNVGREGSEDRRAQKQNVLVLWALAQLCVVGTGFTTEPHHQEVAAFYSFQSTALETDPELPLFACQMVLSPLTLARTLPSTTVCLMYGLISLTPAICLTSQVRTSGLRGCKLSQDAEGDVSLFHVWVCTPEP